MSQVGAARGFILQWSELRRGHAHKGRIAGEAGAHPCNLFSDDSAVALTPLERRGRRVACTPLATLRTGSRNIRRIGPCMCQRQQRCGAQGVSVNRLQTFLCAAMQ